MSQEHEKKSICVLAWKAFFYGGGVCWYLSTYKYFCPAYGKMYFYTYATEIDSATVAVRAEKNIIYIYTYAT